MGKVEFPIAEIDGNRFQLRVDLNCYDREAVAATAYRFTDRYFIHQQTDPDSPSVLLVVFESRSSSAVDEADVKNFCNELIDQQVRVDVNEKFGKIRDMIVEEAFKPVSK